jgi:hypothetical protein
MSGQPNAKVLEEHFRVSKPPGTAVLHAVLKGHLHPEMRKGNALLTCPGKRSLWTPTHRT